VLTTTDNIYKTLIAYAENHITHTIHHKNYCGRNVEIDILSTNDGTCCYVQFASECCPISPQNLLKTVEEMSSVLFHVLEYVKQEQDFRMLYASTQGKDNSVVVDVLQYKNYYRSMKTTKGNYYCRI
jgi:hypothetical protein